MSLMFVLWSVWVLSLPSFTWTQTYIGDGPRYGMTCHLVGNRQMLTVGGNEGSSITSNCDWETKSVAIYDMATLQWGSIFTYNAPPYEVPQRLTDVIGGGYVTLCIYACRGMVLTHNTDQLVTLLRSHQSVASTILALNFSSSLVQLPTRQTQTHQPHHHRPMIPQDQNLLQVLVQSPVVSLVVSPL